MNGNFNSAPPPPSAPVLEQLHALLVVLSNPALTQAHLDALEQAHAQNLASTAELVAERERNQKALDAVADLRTREEALAVKESELQDASTRMAVASAAHSERERQVARREEAVAKRAADLAAAEQKLADKAAAFRAAIA